MPPGGLQGDRLDQIQAIRKAHPGEEVRSWFEDQARFGQQGTITRVWARRVRQDGRESLYVPTAGCAVSGVSVGLIMPELDTSVVNLFLEESSRPLATGVRAVLRRDNAGYHVSRGLMVRPDVGLIGRLPYSPELNPAGDRWHYLRAVDMVRWGVPR